MEKFNSKYTAKTPDDKGYIDYSEQENQTWSTLYTRMMGIIDNYACDEYIQGLSKLGITGECVPQLPEISQRLLAETGWGVEPVPALIPLDRFFELLASKRFPAASFIRIPEELDYVEEPDIFHELFGHCPLLTNQAFADFAQKYGEITLQMNESDRMMMQRLYWFTVEFGLIKTAKGIRNYGGGILSSFSETQYAVDSDIAKREPLGDGTEALRTPFRIDILQPVYFYIESFKQLYDIINGDPAALIKKAHELGEHAPLFEVDESVATMHIRVC
ncbi:MAG: phenylalanine 4-monooxygenase [Coxiellaceae bacterium]|nr:phenylalanine 4-monooxygenase [Coxiellaceae bacterium]